ncbi:MAG: FprA family A-type flavoprotein [Lentisphaeraceae bacterium]|nr:FprA family A-type flavoprotein [Lentisphaeraceae bacterium]
MNTELVKQVHWVGYVDWPVRDFHGYQTKRGSSYNAYLVQGAEKVALIDTVKAPYADYLKQNVAAHCPLSKIDYLVCNHAEPDHSGSFPAMVAACPQAEVVCNAKCKDALSRHYDTTGWKFRVVKEGETLDLGGRTLQFFDTVMCHWPESMVTYLVEEELLFSMDIFGQHYATYCRFDDEANMAEVMQEAKTYYANIVLLYAKPVAAAAKKLLGLKLKMVAPSHGVIWRSHFQEILNAYLAWHVSKPTKKVIVFYSTMWQSTRQMAEAIVRGANEFDVQVKLFDLKAVGDTELITELMDCAAFACGTPTLNQSLMPRMAAALTYIRGLKPAGKKAFSFGSFGWASKGAEEAQEYLKAFGCELLCEPITCKFAPDAATLEKCLEAGRALGRAAAAIEA